MARVSIVEDNATIRELIAAKLRARGHSVRALEDAASAIAARRDDDELYIVDVMLPGSVSGLELCQHLRWKDSSVPILFLSAMSSPNDRVEGLRRGADDYLGKPFEMEELILRVERLLERRLLYQNNKGTAVYRWAGNSIDFDKHLGSHGERCFDLSTKQSRLMRLLIEREGCVVSREEILDRVWGYHLFPSTRTVDNFVLRLRQLFEDNPSSPKHIHSVRGMGYKFVR